MLLEREAAINTFNNALAESKRAGKVLLLGAEAGMGKTTLLEHMREISKDAYTVYWSGCDPLFTPRPFAPIHDFARQFAPELFPVLNSNDKTAKTASQIILAFFNRLEKFDKPTLLIIEDVHWADNATLDMLQYIVRRISVVPCLLCLSYRVDEVTIEHPFSTVINLVPSAHARRVELTPLSLESVKSLAKGKHSDPEKLHEISSGNPFFISEILATDQQLNKDVPSSVRDAVGARLNSLNNDEKSLLTTLCFIPYSIPLVLIKHLFPQDNQNSLASCLSRKFLNTDIDDEFRFNHELSRLAILSTVPIHIQKQTHANILLAIEALKLTDNLAWLVHHAELALDHVKVLEYAPEAAMQAAKLGAHKEAASYYSKAIKYIEYADSELAAKLYESWAYEAGLTIQTDTSVIDARRTAITLYRALGRKEKVAENLRNLSRLYWYQGQSERAEQLANQAISEFEKLPASSELAMAYSMRSQLDMLNDRTQNAIFWGQKALAIEKQFANPLVRAHALTNVGSALVMHGDASGEALLQESLEVSIENGIHEEAARVYTNYSDYCVRFKLLDKAEEMTTQGIQFDIAHELDAWTYYLVGLQAQLRLEQGRLVNAETIAKGVKSLKNQTVLMQLPSLIVLAKTQLRMGVDECVDNLQEALKNANAINEYQYLVPIHFAFIERAWLFDSPNSVAEHIDLISKIANEVLNTWQIGELITWHKRLGLKIISEEQQQTLYLRAAKPYQLEFDGEFVSAAEHWYSLSMPYHAALAYMQIDESDKFMQKAIDLLEPISAHAALKKLRKLANHRGLHESLSKAKRGPYSKTRQHPAQLTSKEQYVLRLLVTGASNQEIATTMSRSQRTIENHVSSILNKLSVNNRIEVMLRVQNEPWLAD
ncbi:helix-turn-helix transcriptional regulator [Glaciecola petra]|uniref:AAA family ATPase n=1 Tax=Glaciecola petra TaxID=3075602 RepID=A0ABU2ZRL5_9ALTE|nr:AAA family ATPase [Aestuariibacter sp. P117]MDT0595275.1 AAA family ATPase [Aestuariibacter sp. P117]